MALFHLSVTQTKRSAGQSAIASAAYRAGERLYSEYYGEYSDYTRKGGVICSDILLPSHGIPVFTAISVWKWKDILKQRSISAWLKKAQTGRDFMGKPSKYEKETIVNFNEGEKEASIYTFNADLKRRLAEFSKKYPLLCRLEKSTPEGSVTYVLDKSRLSIRLVPPYSEERRAAARAYAKEHGFKSMPGGKDIA